MTYPLNRERPNVRFPDGCLATRGPAKSFFHPAVMPAGVITRDVALMINSDAPALINRTAGL
jgi:hypothetical protein